MYKFSTLTAIILALVFCQCRKDSIEDDKGRDYPSREAFVVIDSCMGHMSSDPQKAHRMLDSMREEGLMSRQRCEYFHAMVTFTGEQLLDSALMMCDRMLEADDFGDDRFLEEELCVLATDITTANRRHMQTLKYARRGITICHGDNKMRGDEAVLLGRVGAAEQGLGRTKEARETYERAIQLIKVEDSFADLVAQISLLKKQAGLYKEEKEYDKMIDVCHDVLHLVALFDRNPSFVKQRPETMQTSGAGTHDFADFYECQMYSLIARAYRLKIISGMSANAKAERDSVAAYIDRWSMTHKSQSPDCQASVLPELYFAGRMAEFKRAKIKAENLYKGDSLVPEYVEYLTLVAKEAADHHDLATSNEYLSRALAVSDSIRQKELVRELTEQMSLNMVQEQTLARQDAERQLKYHRWIILLQSGMLIVIVIAGLVIIFLVRKNKKNKQILETTQQDLNESMHEIEGLVHQLEESKTDKMVSNTKALYERIVDVMSEKQLYLYPDLDIKMVAEAALSSRSMVSACINSLTGKTFRQWLSEYRLNLFAMMLQENPNTNIDELMAKCGYRDQSTFRRQFKTTYGMTAGEFRKQLILFTESQNTDSSNTDSSNTDSSNTDSSNTDSLNTESLKDQKEEEI